MFDLNYKMENIILIGHGSPKEDANTIDIIGGLLHKRIHHGCNRDCIKPAYLQFARPDIMESIKTCVAGGATRIILHPYFLYSGMHVTQDIPAIIKEAEAIYPEVEFIYTEPLGVHEKLIDIVIEKINDATRPDISSGKTAVIKEGQHPIEKKSFDIISEELDLSDIPNERLPILKRVIHSTADFEFKKTLVFHPDAIKTGIAAIRAGKNILTDIEMVKAGINKRLLQRWGGKVLCRISDDEVVKTSKETGKTRAETAMEKGLEDNIGIIVIGNAPTALLKVIDILNQDSRLKPQDSLVIGVPVGFVDALEAKTLLASQKFPFITNLSRKGGTPVGVAIINALLIMAQED